MTAGGMVRLLIYVAIALVLLGFVFLVLIMAAMLLFGIALVRADLFAVLAGAYWIMGAPAALFIAYRLAVGAPRSETPSQN